MTSYDPRLTTYFGDGALDAGFLPVPHLFLRHYRQVGLSPAHAMFVLEIMAGTWDLRAPPRTVGEFAQRMGVDKRTIRKYTEEMVALGLLTLTDRFDNSGAQIENEYDLGGLFARLTSTVNESVSFTPVPASETGRHSCENDATHVTRPTSQPEPGRNNGSAPPEEQTIRPGEDCMHHPEVDYGIRPPRPTKSSLKQELTKNHQMVMIDNANVELEQKPPSCANGSGHDATEVSIAPGWSIRWQQPLTLAEVEASTELLRRMQIDRPLRDTVAKSLAPAEAWALRTLAEARGWRTGLIIRELYDFAARDCRAAGNLETSHDNVGRRLATLDPDVSEHLLQLVSRHCPQNPHAVVCGIDSRDDIVRTTVEELWNVVSVQRGNRGLILTFPQGHVAPPAPAGTNNLDEIWHLAQRYLQRHVSAEAYVTWLASTWLLDLSEVKAIVGVPHVFAHDAIVSNHTPAIEEALEAVLSRRVTASIAIGSPSTAVRI